MRANSHKILVTATSHGDKGEFNLEQGPWGNPSVHGDVVLPMVGIHTQQQQTRPGAEFLTMQEHRSEINGASTQELPYLPSDITHRMSGEIGIELSPATGVSTDAKMSRQDCQLVRVPSSLHQDFNRPSKLPKQAPGRSNLMAQSITRFFRRAKTACHVTVDSAHTNAAESHVPDTKVSKKRRLGHLQESSFQQPRSLTPSCYGLVAEADQPKPAKRIPGMFKAKRMLAALSDTGKLSKDRKRTTLSTTVSATSCPQTLFSEDNGPENYTISSTLKSVFDVADVCEAHENDQQLKSHISMQHVVSPAGSSGTLPCAMAPKNLSPTFCPRLEVATAHQKCCEGTPSTQILDLCTPAQSSTGGRILGEVSFESVHTPPEVVLPAVLECPGAPIKKRGDTDAYEVVSRLSSLSVDSIHVCDSPFAPGAPAWSPRAEVRRALRFD